MESALRGSGEREEGWASRPSSASSPTHLEDSRTMLVYDSLVTIGMPLHEVQGNDAEPCGRPQGVGAQVARSS